MRIIDDDGSSIDYDVFGNVLGSIGTDGTVYPAGVPISQTAGGVLSGSTVDYGLRRLIDSVFGPSASQQVTAYAPAQASGIKLNQFAGIAAVAAGAFLLFKLAK